MNLNIQQLMLGIASGVISFHFHRIVEKKSLSDCILYMYRLHRIREMVANDILECYP